jgi:hypothetical protein
MVAEHGNFLIGLAMKKIGGAIDNEPLEEKEKILLLSPWAEQNLIGFGAMKIVFIAVSPDEIELFRGVLERAREVDSGSAPRPGDEYFSHWAAIIPITEML